MGASHSRRKRPSSRRSGVANKPEYTLTAVTRKVAFYVDGLNLYHGMMGAGLGHCRWLDVGKMAKRLVDPGDTIAFVRYFNAPAWIKPKLARQQVYLEAVSTHDPAVTIHLGGFKTKYWYCSRCHTSNTRHEEKRTDVAIGAHLIHDLYSDDSFDAVTLVSGDSDLLAAVEVARNARSVQIRAAFPPRRESADLKKAVDNHRRVKAVHLEESQLPNPVPCPDGRQLHRPLEWV